MAFPKVAERFCLKAVDETVINHLVDELHIKPLLARIFAARGLADGSAVEAFFKHDIANLFDPFLFADMRAAVVRISAAIDKKEKITIYGDYDVDGITATVLLVRVLRTLGATCDWHLPNRIIDGYGISAEAIAAIAAGGTTLLISVDCGITAVTEIESARALGVDVIVTDHHEPSLKLPPALCIINPKAPGSNYPEKILAGVGVACKLAQALTQHLGRPAAIWQDQLDLVALGTAADIVPLTGENRIIMRAGFARMKQTVNPGLRALIAVQGLAGKDLSTRQVVFSLAPCINATGRLGDAERSVNLLLTDDPAAAQSYAAELRDANVQRQTLHAEVQQDVFAWIDKNCDAARDYAIVAASQNWHCGVIGIVASKVVEKYHRPAILLSIGENGMCRGSGRSLPTVHLLSAISECTDLLDHFGGHAVAAGMSIRSEHIDAFRTRLNDTVRSRVTPEDLLPTITADAEVALDDCTSEFLRTVQRMEPFGPGNMRPVLICRGLRMQSESRIVGKNHLKMTVGAQGKRMDAIAFGMGDRRKELTGAAAFSLAFSLELNDWNNTLQMNVRGAEL